MKGTIELKVDGANIECHVKMSAMEDFDRLVLVDSLVRGLRVSREERVKMGLTIAAGGLDVIMGASIDETIVDLSALKRQKTEEDLTSHEK